MVEITDSVMKPVRLTCPDHEPFLYSAPRHRDPPIRRNPARRASMLPGLAASLLVIMVMAAAATAMLGTRQELGEGRSARVEIPNR